MGLTEINNNGNIIINSIKSAKLLIVNLGIRNKIET